MSTVSVELAQQIMGKYYISPAAVTEQLEVEYTDQQASALLTIPFSEARLKVCASTHVLLPGAPLSILEIRERVERKGEFFYSPKKAWYNNESFAKHEQVQAAWYLIRKEAVAGSCNKTWNEQLALLQVEEVTPRACEFVYGIILTDLATSTRLFVEGYARCNSLTTTRSRRVYAGDYNPEGLRIDRIRMGLQRRQALGLAGCYM